MTEYSDKQELYDEYEELPTEEESIQEKKIVIGKQLLIIIQLIICGIALLFMLVIKLIGGDFWGLTDDQIKVLRILDDKEPMLTDDIALRANVPVRRILSAVTMLEIDGYTRQEGLRKFVRTVEVEDTKE